MILKLTLSLKNTVEAVIYEMQMAPIPGFQQTHSRPSCFRAV